MDDHLTKPLDEAALERVLVRYVLAPGCVRSSAAPDPAGTETIPAPAKLSLEARYALRKAAALETIRSAIDEGRLSEAAIAEMKSVAHQLAGTAGMFGDARLGEEARALELGLETWPAANALENIRAAYRVLQRIAASGG